MSWSKHPITWRENGRLHISVVFTWHLPEVRRYCEYLPETPIVGGPAVRLMPDYLRDVAEIGNDSPGALQRHNPQATRTTLGCPRGCGFCGVTRIEPEYVELASWPIAPIVCDNNLLAASDKHCERVIDSLRGVRGVDFNQGLDARLLTTEHARQLAQLDCKPRIAWDHISDEAAVFRAIDVLHAAGFPLRRIGCYVLFGFNDTPADALYRFQTLKTYGIEKPNPMRYQPLDCLTKNAYVAPGWTERLLRGMQRFWARQAWFGGLRFEDYIGTVEARR